MRNIPTFLLILVAALACDDGGGAGNQETPQPEAGIRDAFVNPDAARPDGGAGGMGGMAGAGGMGGMGGMAGAGGEGGAGGGIRMLAGCADICAVYADCGVEAQYFPGGAAECQARCADAEASDRFNDYLTCMQITRCEDLGRCTIPQRPLPACADVCTALAACDPAPRLPAGLPGIEACADACGDASLARVVSSCGAAVLGSNGAVDGACDAAAFDACVLDQRGGACALECTTRAGCDAAVDATTCTLECLTATTPEDPVAARRIDQSRACVRNAADCDELAACDARQRRAIVGEHTIDDLCAANAACGFLSVDACPEVAADLLPRLADGAVDCFTDHFTDQCGQPPYACFDPAPAPDGGCEEHCLVSDLCGLLPDGQSEFDCLEICQGALASGDPTAIDPYLPFFECAYLGTCDEVSSCQLDADFRASCLAMCNAQIACGSPGAAECYDECLARPATRRMKAERACIAVADGCDNVALCLAPPPPDCAALCAPLDDCRLTDRRCPISCDDADFADPTSFLPLLSCVNSTARCADRATCTGGDTSGGDLCLAWCQARVGCVEGAEQTMSDCVLECGRGEVGGQRGLVLASAAECLLAAGADAACPDLRRCLDGADFHGFCPAYCADLARCRLEDDVPGCVAACQAVEDDAGFFAEAACTLNAERRGESCEAIATCVHAELPPIPRACRQVCEAEARCDDSVDAFLCGLDCDPARAGIDIEAGCARFAPCDQLGRCADPPVEIPRGCAAACGVIAGCGGLVGPDGTFEDFDHCTAECAGASILLGAGFPARLQGCAEDAACDADAVVACFMVPEDACEAGQEAVTACGLDQAPIPGFPPLVPDYLGDCRRLQMQDPAAALAQVQCLEEVAQRAAGGDPLACFDAFACGVGGF
ncbi:MAG: hypothetical protein R3F60_23825 [bacterium]